MSALDRAAQRMARLHGKISVEAYSVAFEVLVDALEIDPVTLAREVMAWRLQFAADAGAEVTYA